MSSALYSTSAMSRMSSPVSVASASPIRRERWQMTRTASSSESPPVMYAPAASPIECPTTTPASAPWWRSSSASADLDGEDADL